MLNTHEQRFRPARIISLVSMMILCGSVARAEVVELTAKPAPAPRFSPTLASSLALLPRQVTRETWTLRTDLAREKRLDRIAAVKRKGWAKDHAAAGQKAAAPAPAAARAPTAARAPAPAPAPAPPPSSADWYAIAQCESGGVWSISTGNGYWGGLQFASSTWFAYGGGPYDGTGPFPYSAAQQIAVAERVLAAQGPGAWPNCFRWA